MENYDNGGLVDSEMEAEPERAPSSAGFGLWFVMGRACLPRYYPYHYAPFLSDIKNVSELKLTFDLEKPFMPFQQLLAVLPAASMELLPEAYRVTAPVITLL